MLNHLVQDFYPFFIALCRFAGFTAFLPIMGQAEIPARVRGMIAIVIALCFTPTLHLPSDLSPSFTEIFFLGLKEFAIGLFLGITARALASTLDMAGTIISFQLNLSNAALFNPAVGAQSPIVSVMLMLAGSATLLHLNLHHLLFQGFKASYILFPLTGSLFSEDIAASYSQLFSRIFRMAVQLSAPFLVIGIVMQLASGFLNRLMPNLQIFFVAMPAHIGLGIIMLMLLVSGILQGFSVFFENEFQHLLHIGP